MGALIAPQLSKTQRINHDLINSLASLRSLSELLMDYPALPSGDRIRFLNLIIDETDRMVGLVGQLK